MSITNSLNIAVVCSSNMNRSMEAHNFLAKKGYNVRSFGTGERVKLPGTTFDKPNIYEFGTPYDIIYNDLVIKDKQYYTQNGLLHMLDRNRRIKKCPERFQDCKDQFDIIVTVEERVYDQVLECMESRDVADNRPVHIFNVDIEDNHEEALMGAFLITDMINMVKIYNYSYKLPQLPLEYVVQERQLIGGKGNQSRSPALGKLLLMQKMFVIKIYMKSMIKLLVLCLFEGFAALLSFLYIWSF